MSIPNVAVAFPQTNRDDIAAGIAALKPHFPVLVPVGPDEREGLQEVAEGREAIVAEAFTDAVANPGTVPPTINLAQWTLIEEQYDGLDGAESLLEELLSLIRGVKAVAGDARYERVLRYYRYLEGNMDALAGGEVIYDKIAKLFEKQGNRTKPAAGGTGGTP